MEARVARRVPVRRPAVPRCPERRMLKMHAGKNHFYGLATGFVVVTGGYGAGHISEGCYNPTTAIVIVASRAGPGFG